LQQTVLADLLLIDTPVAEPTRRSTPHQPYSPLQWPRLPIGRIALAVVGIILVLLVARVASAALSIRQNVQSYIVPTANSERPVASTIQQPTTVLAPIGDPATSSANPEPQTIVAQPQQGANVQANAPTRIPIVPTAIGAAPMAIIPTLPVVTATPRIPLAGTPVTILLLGSDGRPGEEGPTRTDTVIVVRIDPGMRRAAMLSIPRDLIVEIPGYGYGRINAAHVYGDLSPELGGGLNLVRATVSNLLGVPIDYAVLVDFNGFIGLIDAIGGIDIDVPNALYDGEYPTMDYGYMAVSFDPGMQHMDGERALQYARIRHMDSDFERGRRQQEILLAAARHLRERNPLDLLDTLASATSSLRGYVQTDLPEERMAGLAWALRDLAPTAVERYQVDENMISFNGEGGGCSGSDDYWAECANPATIRALVQQWLGGTP
jgi:LCP family protein required for cell wall assembly